MRKIFRSVLTAAIIGAIVFGIYYAVKGVSFFNTKDVSDTAWVAIAVWWVGTSIVNSIDDVVEKLGELVDLAKKAQNQDEYDASDEEGA